jgi:hypothetical protein
MAVVNAISGDRDDFRGGCGMGSHVGEESEHGMIRAGQRRGGGVLWMGNLR